jgi:hypothetical protein
MRNKLGTIGLLAIAAFGVPLANAGSIGYTIDFSEPAGLGFGPSPTAGSFSYDPGTATFTDFTVMWDGDSLDLTNSANNPTIPGSPGCIGGSTGGQATFLFLTACPQNTGSPAWYGNCCSNGEAVFVMVYNGADGLIYISSDPADPNAGSRLAQGDFGAVPEPASCGLMLIGFCWLARKRVIRRIHEGAPRDN